VSRRAQEPVRPTASLWQPRRLVRVVVATTSLTPNWFGACLGRGACLLALLQGRRATSPRLGAATATSAAFATFSWLIQAPRLIGGAGAPLIHRQARINRNNRRVSPPRATPVRSCDGCDGHEGAEAVIRSSSPLWSADGRARMVAQLAWPPAGCRREQGQLPDDAVVDKQMATR
jgi:hypothetical protein